MPSLRKNSVLLLSLIFLIGSLFAFTDKSEAGDGFTQKDRELLIRLDERLNQLDKRFEQVDKRFEQVDRRFEQINIRISELREDMNKRFEIMNKRFEDINKRFEDMNKRFDNMVQIMVGIVGAFVAIVAITIAFALWDRRTMIRPFEEKMSKIEEEIAVNRGKFEALLKALRQLAREDHKLAKVLKEFSLL